MGFKARIIAFKQSVVTKITSKTADYSISETDVGSTLDDAADIIDEVVYQKAESRLYDANFQLYRDYISTAEVEQNFTDPAEQATGLVYYVNTGGTLVDGVITGGERSEWWYVDGVLTSKGSSMVFPEDNTVYIPGDPLKINGTEVSAGDPVLPIILQFLFQTADVTVNASNPGAITLPTSSVNLVGVATKGSTPITSTAWTLLTKPMGASDPVLGTPSIIDNNGNKTNTTGVTGQTTAGDYTYRFTAIDGNTTAHTDVTSHVNAQVIVPPTIDAIAPVTVHLSNSISTAAITAVAHQGTNAITYLWSQISGPTSGVSITNGTTATATINGLDVAGTADYVFRCTVTDGITSVHSDATLHSIVDLPVITNTGTKTIQLPTATAALTATVTTGSYTIASQVWSFVSGPVTATVDPSTGAASGMSTVGDYIFRVTVTDSKGNMVHADETVHQTAAALLFYYDFFDTDPSVGDTADLTAIALTHSVAVTPGGAWTIPNASAGNGKWFMGKILASQADRVYWNNDNGLNQGPIPGPEYKATQTVSGNKYQLSRDLINLNPSITQLSFT